MTMKSCGRPLLFSLSCLAAWAAQAADFSASAKPGLWKMDQQMLINGQDVRKTMLETQKKMLQNAPPEVRDEMMAKLDAQEKGLQCVTPTQAARMATADAYLASMNDNPDACRYELTDETANSFKFSGHCDTEDGFDGDMSGEVVVKSDEAFTMTMKGTGTVPAAGGEEMSQDMRVSAQWLGADCGDVLPDDEG